LSAATICSSTTGPHIWLLHNRGVAKVTTVGRPAARALSSEMACSGQAGSRVQIFLRPAAVVATGVASGLALLPTAAGTLAATATAPWPTARPPSMSRAAATIQSPASGNSTWAP
jgi:hypothetical protein